MSETYTATLLDGNTRETLELEMISGLPQKSFVRATDSGSGGEMVWELVAGTEYEYRPVGIPGADYS